MGELVETLKKEVDGFDRDVFAVGKMDSLQGRWSFDEGVNGVVSKVGDLEVE
jgi:hypothetical protein